jgi:hypothetical protein
LARRDAARQARVAEINAVKATLPQRAFTLPITTLDLPDSIIEVLQPLENVGEIMWRFLIDEDRLRYLLKDLPDDSLMRVQAALDKIVIPEGDEEPAAVEEPVDEIEVAPIAAAPVVDGEAVEDDVVPAGAFGDEDLPIDAPKPVKPAGIWKEKPVVVAAVAEDEEDDDLLDNKPSGKKKSEKKKERLQRRQLIFDEEIGQVIAKRRRKGGRGTDEWEEE